MSHDTVYRSSQSTPDEKYLDALAAALNGNPEAFASITEPHRKELMTHCYRILGSLEDAEDNVQETFLRAWRRLQTYQGKGSLRSWLYKIATNVCLDTLAHRPKRSLPVELYPPADPSLPPEPSVNAPVWLEPYPDELLSPVDASPEALYESRESISFAFMIALQELPVRQRCALILGDVLDWRAVEIANTLAIFGLGSQQLALSCPFHPEEAPPAQSLGKTLSK